MDRKRAVAAGSSRSGAAGDEDGALQPESQHHSGASRSGGGSDSGGAAPADHPPTRRQARTSGLVAQFMTAIIFLCAVLACAYIFHIIPGLDVILHQQSWHLPGSVPHARPVVDPTAGSTPLSQQPQQQHKDSSSPSQQQPPPPTPPPPSPVAAPHLPAHDFCPRLTAELLRKQAQRGAVMVAYTEFEDFKLYGRTFLHHLKQAGVGYHVLAVPDLRSARLVASYGAPCFTMDDAEAYEQQLQEKKRVVSRRPVGSKPPPPSKVHTWRKVAAARRVHQLGLHVVWSGLDVVWFRDPLTYLLGTPPQPDFVVSIDPSITRNPLGDEGLEVGVSLGHYVNTGIYFLRATPGGSKLVDAWWALAGDKPYTQRWTEQEGLVLHLQAQKGSATVDAAARVIRLFGGATSLGQLTPVLFQGGYSHAINKLHEVHKVKPYALHMTWVYSGEEGKIHRLRELQYAVDDAPYYEEGLYITVGMTPVEPKPGFNEMTDSYAMAEHHWAVMRQQMRDLYYALWIAYLADRVLVLPRLQCHCVHNWFETQRCRLPGDNVTRLPFTCPMDYVLDLEQLRVTLVTMRKLRVREYSWLENPLTHSKYKTKKPFVVRAGDVPHPKHERHQHVLPFKFKDFELVSELGRLKHQPIIHVPNPEKLYRGFTHPHLQHEFDAALSKLPVTWCCLPDTVVKARNLTDGKHAFQLKP